MGMTNNQMGLIRAVAENKLSDVKKYALCCCEEDKTQKNAEFVAKYKNLLKNNSTMIELPYNIQGMVQFEDVSASFNEKRYFLSERESKLFKKISNMNEVGLKLMGMGIPYLNAILLTGVSGTGKTTFGRYTAYKLGLPFLYINFSLLIDSHMGETAKNLKKVFDFAKVTKCILMLDEMDAIAQRRNGSTEGSIRESNNTTITLLQELDKIQNDTIIIGATNILTTIDQAVIRRFSYHHEMLPLTKDECINMADQYLSDINMKYEKKDVVEWADKLYGTSSNMTQATILNSIINRIADAIMDGKDTVSMI